MLSSDIQCRTNGLLFAVIFLMSIAVKFSNADCEGTTSIFSCLTGNGTRYAINSTIHLTILTTKSLVNNDVYSWKFDDKNILQVLYFSGSWNEIFIDNLYKARLTHSETAVSGGVSLDLIVSGMLQSEDGISVTVTQTSTTSNKYQLVIKACNTSELDELTAISSEPCGYQCEANVTCKDNESITTVCLSNATWDNECITETTTIEPTARIISSTAGQSAVSTESSASNDISSTTSDNSTGGNKGNNGGLSDGAIAGIVIAVVVVVGAGVAGTVFYFKKSA